MSARDAVARRPRRVAPSETDASFAAAADAFRRADYAGSLRLSEFARSLGDADGRMAVLRVRLAQVAGESEDLYEEARSAARHALSDADRLTVLALQVAGARSLGKTAEAVRLERELEGAFATGVAADGLDATKILALDACDAGDFDRAERFVQRNLRADADDAEDIVLLGRIELGRERLSAAGGYFTRAIAQLEGSDAPDVGVLARALAGAATVSSEMVNLRMGHRLRRTYDEVTWTGGTRREQFDTVTNLRMLALLEGDLEDAWVLSRAAVAIAPNRAHEAIAETNAAVATRMLGDEHTSSLQLARAWEALRGVRWREAARCDRLALLTFAAEGARAMPTQARKALSTFRSALAGRGGDTRADALEAMAAGRTAEVHGDRAGAIRAYRQSLEWWLEHGLTLRAAIVGLDLRRLTRDESYAEAAEAVLKRAPDAWFARELREAKSPLRHLRNAQREILAHLLRGESAKMIASELDRSTFTISNHTRKIFNAFNVHSRDDLRAKCAKLGITDEGLRRAL